uniref:Uncharacterized protein n=1 Tax=Anguilla anguilla TaxID=7936 RepID=A0A0E9Q8F3_ANGAN
MANFAVNYLKSIILSRPDTVLSTNII